MEITVIYATPRKEKSSTYMIAGEFIKNLSLGDTVHSFTLPKDMPHFCYGCFKCIIGEPEKCPAYQCLEPIKAAMDSSDLIIFTAPTYVYHVPGTLKAFLDHFGYQWIIHRPNEKMFKKQILVISTAAGAGTKPTVKDVKHSADYWGAARFYAYKKSVFSMDWSGVKAKEQIFREVKQLSNKIMRESKNIKPRLKVKLYFNFFRIMQKKMTFSPADSKYWKEKGWLEKKRPY